MPSLSNGWAFVFSASSSPAHTPQARKGNHRNEHQLGPHPVSLSAPEHSAHSQSKLKTEAKLRFIDSGECARDNWPFSPTDLSCTAGPGLPYAFRHLLQLPLCALPRSGAASFHRVPLQEHCTLGTGSQSPACPASTQIPQRTRRKL